MDAVKVGKRIKEARMARKLTQAVVAQKVDITTKYLSNIECGEKLPRLETFVSIANAIGADANSLLVDVLTVSPSIMGNTLQQKLASLPPADQKTVLQMLDVLVDSMRKQP